MPRSLKPVSSRQADLQQRFPVWKARTLDQMLDATTREFPDREFVITDQRHYSYRQINDWATRLACGLVKAGIKPGEHVALVMANYPEFVALKFAIARAGAVAVPLNFLNRTAELGYVLAQSDARVLITMDSFRGLDYQQMLDQLVPGWERQGGGKQFPKLRRIFVFPASGQRLRSSVSQFTDLEVDAAGWTPAVAGDPDAIADIIYTSGTTGGPKGVLLSHDMLLRTAYGSAYARAFEDGRRILFSMPMYHVYGYVEGLLAALLVAGAIIPQLQFSPETTLRGIERHGANDLLLIPTMTLALLDALRVGSYDLAGLGAMLSSGGKAPETIWQQIYELFGPLELTTGYGMSEATASTTVTRPDDPLERLQTTNGRLRDVGVAGDPDLGGKLVAYRVVDPLTGEELPRGSMGELRLKGPGVTRGYYHKPEATAAAFDSEGWLRSGDLGRIDADDYITLLGRIKECYRCGGEQVIPLDIEDVLLSHDSVAQAYVVPVPDVRMGEVGAAFVILKDGMTATASELTEFCAQRLASFKTPKYVFFINAQELPVTATGRPRKFLLTERAIKMLEVA